MADYQELLDCAICLQMLKEPVTAACGHSFCMECINTFWDQDHNKERVYTCPQCRHAFTPRPSLKKNTLLADLLEKHKKEKEEKEKQNTSFDCASPDDVACDACIERIKRKAVKFCIECMAFYCDTHLSPHLNVPPLKKHKLVEPTKNIKESICCRHEKLLEIYCRTDQQCICLMCTMENHKGHDTIPVAAAITEKQRQLWETKQEIHLSTQTRKRQVEDLTHAIDTVRDVAWKTVDDFERFCREHISLYVRIIERMCSEMREKVGETDKSAVDSTNYLLGQLEQEISKLRRRDTQLDKLSCIDDPIQFLQSFQTLHESPASRALPKSLEEVLFFVSVQTDRMHKMCMEEKYKVMNMLVKNISVHSYQVKKVTNSMGRPFFKNSKIEVDPNTIAACLSLSQGNTMISWGDVDQAHPDHSDRFTYYHQALCKEGLTCDSYWEVEWDGGTVEIAVSYKGIARKGSGNDCSFGHNNLSWSLTCSPFACSFWHNNLQKRNIPRPCCLKIGVDLQYEEGILSFFSVSGTQQPTCLHKIQTTFTEPVYPGFCVDLGSTLKLCKL